MRFMRKVFGENWMLFAVVAAIIIVRYTKFDITKMVNDYVKG